MSYSELAQRYSRFHNPAFVRLLDTLGYGRAFVRAERTRVWDDTGQTYLDCLAGFGSHNLGHHHPGLVQALRDALDEQPYTFLHVGLSEPLAAAAEAIASKLPAPLGMCLFSTSGAEAVEGAMKAAILATRRKRFGYFRHAFHGTSLGTLSVMGHPRMRQHVSGVLPAGFVELPFGDLASARAALESHTLAAVVAEPILAEGGVIEPPPGYLDELLGLCRNTGTLLIADEIQTGLGRTGAWLATSAMHEPPDMIVLGKALSGGLLPISATILSPELFARSYGKRGCFDLHNSTFAGNALSCRIARRTIELLDEEGCIGNAATMGAFLKASLARALHGHPLVQSVRGKGLLIGIELGPTDRGLLARIAPGMVERAAREALGWWICVRLLEQGLLAQPASNRVDVIKLEPPLVLTRAEAEEIVRAVRDVFWEHESVPALMLQISRRLGSQWMARNTGAG